MNSPVAKADNRLADARARGIVGRRKLMEAEGDSLSAEEASRELGISKAAISARYRKGKLIGWHDERQDAVRFPVWQFKDGELLDGLEEVFIALNAGNLLDDIGRMLFFLANHGYLGGESPLDCLRAGDVNKALRAAEGYVR